MDNATATAIKLIVALYITDPAPKITKKHSRNDDTLLLGTATTISTMLDGLTVNQAKRPRQTPSDYYIEPRQRIWSEKIILSHQCSTCVQSIVLLSSA